MRYLVIALPAALALAACGQIEQARDAAFSVGAGAYVDQVCSPTGVAAETFRAEQREALYAQSGGLYAEADCDYQPGDTTADFWTRKRQDAADSLDGASVVIVTPDPPDPPPS